jgi:MFS family permease
MIGIAALGCGILALYLVLIILAIIGFWGVYKGKMEYGVAHEKDVGRAMTFFITAIILFFASMAIAFAALVASLGDISNPSGATYALTPVYAAVSAVLGMIFSAMVALIPYYLIKAFTPPEKQNLGIAAVGLYVLGTVLSSVLSWVFPISSYILDSNPLWIVPSLVSGLLGIISLVLFLVLYRDAHRRLKSHLIKPFWEAMAAQYPLQAQEYRWQPPPSP